MIEAFEATLVYLHYFVLYCCWRIDLLNSVTALVSTASHYVFLHLELQAAVVSD